MRLGSNIIMEVILWFFPFLNKDLHCGYSSIKSLFMDVFVEHTPNLTQLLTSSRHLKDDWKKTDPIGPLGLHLSYNFQDLDHSSYSPVSHSSVLIYVVEGHPLFAIPWVGNYVICCCTGELSSL